MKGVLDVGILSYLLGPGIIPQFFLGFLLSLLLYILMLSAEIIYKNVSRVVSTRVDILPLTVSANVKPREFEQNPMLPKHLLLPASDNERTGAEFSYAFWIWIDPASFGQEEGLLHVLNKGNPFPYPLLGPGVFLKNNVNTLRVYVNSSTTWNNYTDVENIPVNKWVHVVISARSNTVEVYINGNIAKKLNMERGVIYQNFGNLYVFSQRKCLLNPTIIPSLENKPYTVFGPYSGQMSRLVYFNYSLSYTEIRSLLEQGPNSQTETSASQTPPYLEDKWWVTSYNAGG